MNSIDFWINVISKTKLQTLPFPVFIASLITFSHSSRVEQLSGLEFKVKRAENRALGDHLCSNLWYLFLPTFNICEIFVWSFMRQPLSICFCERSIFVKYLRDYLCANLYNLLLLIPDFHMYRVYTIEPVLYGVIC